VDPTPMPAPLRAAKEWAAFNLATFGQRHSCHTCHSVSTACLHCSTCDHSFCRPCLGLQDGELWSLGFQCHACIVHDACLDPSTPVDPGVERLAKSMLVTVAAALKPGTWALYQRCISDMLRFSKRFSVRLFPVASREAAQGVALFLEYLRENGFSWARISHYRAALRSLCEAGELPDPFTTFPVLKSICEGLKKRITLRPRRKEGVTLLMVQALLEFWERSEDVARKAGNTRLADTALRNQVAVILGWCGMRRASEIFINKDGTMGLRRSHVSWVRGSHITLFVQAMKNDPYGVGNEVILAWITASGIRVGDTLMRYIARLDACNIPEDAGLLLPTRVSGFVLPAKGRGFRPTDCLRKGLQQCFQEFSCPELRQRFSWHSLRRGGASHAVRQQADHRLVMGHGLWKSEEGMRPYMTADLAGKLVVTQMM